MCILVGALAGCSSAPDRYPTLMECKATVTIRWASPDVVNAYGRDEGGLGVQALSATKSTAGLIYVAWPPSKDDGMALENLDRALGYEMRENLCHRARDDKGR